MVRMLTIKQCAEHLQISDRTIRDMISKKKFCPHKRIGGQIRVAEDDFENWINSCEDERLKYEREKNSRVIKQINRILG